MQSTRLIAPVLAALLLAGCQSSPTTPTYDKIKRELGQCRRPASGRRAERRQGRRRRAAAAGGQLATQLPRARPALEERFNVAFNNVPAQQFFRSIVAGTRYNILVHPDVSGSITANLKDVTLPETLDAVREMYGYDYKIEGTRISIKPLTMQTKMFRVNYLVGKRGGTSNLRVTSTSVSNAVNQNGNGRATQGNQNNQNNANNQNNQNGQNGHQQQESTDVTTQNRTISGAT
jgi:MSHA biogenesis protein MshL